MSLSLLMTTLTEYVADVLLNECGRPAPGRMFSYRGPAPDDCCTEAGTLSTWWEDGRLSTDFPASSAGQRNDPCAAIPLYTVNLRYSVCWPVPEVTDDGIVVSAEQDQAYHAKASMLADVGDCVLRHLNRLRCQPAPGTAAADAVIAQVARGWLRTVSVSPNLATGDCAGVTWRVYAAPLPAAPVS